MTMKPNQQKMLQRKPKQDAMERKQRVYEQAEEYRKTVADDIPPPKCISDKILLYMRYGIHALWLKHGTQWVEENYNDFYQWCIGVYRDRIRGEMMYTNMKPDTVAACLLYMGSVLHGINVTQQDVADVFASSPVLIRTHYRKIGRNLGMFN